MEVDRDICPRSQRCLEQSLLNNDRLFLTRFTLARPGSSLTEKLFLQPFSLLVAKVH